MYEGLENFLKPSLPPDLKVIEDLHSPTFIVYLLSQKMTTQIFDIPYKVWSAI